MTKELKNYVMMAICLLGIIFALAYPYVAHGQEAVAEKSNQGSRPGWYVITGGEYVFADDNPDLLIIHTIEPMTSLKDQVIRTKKDLKFIADPKITTLYLGLTEHNNLYSRVMTTIFSHRRVNIIKYPMDSWDDMLPAIKQIFRKVFGP